MSYSKLFLPKNLGAAPEYIFGGIRPDSGLTLVPDFTRQPRSWLRRVLKFLLVGRLRLSSRMLALITGFEGYRRLSDIGPADRLLLDGVSNLHTLQAIRWAVPRETRCYNYFNNSLRFVYGSEAKVMPYVEGMKAMGYSVFTFDRDEAARYAINYAAQHYRYPQPDELAAEPQWDFFFCGAAKDRRERLQALQQMLESKGYKCRFVVVEPGEPGITYAQYLDYVRQSRCIVDLMQQGQTGLTRRPVEALFWNKKLLTENQTITTYDFYRAENICLLTTDVECRIDSFMQAPMASVPSEVKEAYEVNRWLAHFGGEAQ